MDESEEDRLDQMDLDGVQAARSLATAASKPPPKETGMSSSQAIALSDDSDSSDDETNQLAGRLAQNIRTNTTKLGH